MQREHERAPKMVMNTVQFIYDGDDRRLKDGICRHLFNSGMLCVPYFSECSLKNGDTCAEL